MSNIIWDCVVRYGADMGWLPIVRSDNEEVFRGEWHRDYLGAAEQAHREMVLRMNEQPPAGMSFDGLAEGLRALNRMQEDDGAA